MVISYKDFEGIRGSLVRAKGPKKDRVLYERRTPPYDGVPRKIKDFHSIEWNPKTKTFEPRISFVGIAGAYPLSDFEVVNEVI